MVAKVMDCEYLVRHCAGCVDMLREELIDHTSHRDTCLKERDLEYEEVVAGRLKRNPKDLWHRARLKVLVFKGFTNTYQQAQEREQKLKDVYVKLKRFDKVRTHLEHCSSAKEVVAMVKERRKLAKELTPLVDFVIELQTKRKEEMEKRYARIAQRIALLGDDVNFEGHIPPGIPAEQMDSALKDFEDTFTEQTAAAPQEKSHTKETGASTPRHRVFPKGSVLGTAVVELLSVLSVLHDDDANTLESLIRGDNTEAQHVSERRDQQRIKVEAELMRLLNVAEKKCRLLVNLSQRHMQHEASRVQGKRAVEKVRAKGTVDYLMDGSSSTAEGSAVTIHIMTERKKELKELADAEKDAKKALKTVKKADKKQQVYNFKIFACQNRQEEAVEFGEISDDSEADDYEMDGDYDVEEIKVLIMELQAKQEKARKRGEQARTTLKGLQTILPELKFEKRLKPPAIAPITHHHESELMAEEAARDGEWKGQSVPGYDD